MVACGVGAAQCKRASGRVVRCASAVKEPAPGRGFALEKPDSHRRRTYELLRLPNGLHAILASDPDCDKAAAALAVGVGRLHEPKSMPGLAHFCEHMLFLGTESFPEEAEYKRFIKQHGGKCNASTGDSTTCYAFDVAPPHLAGALDRFSSFFLTPLFTPSATDREINAVDSEHTMRITDDGRRSYATLLLDANPDHPWHWGSGNARTLRDEPRARGVDLHAEVVRFWQESYSAEDMTLAVLGRESLQELEEMVQKRFSSIRVLGNRALRGDEHGGGELAIRRQDFPGLLLRSPSKDRRTVEFDWQLADWQVRLWSTKPSAYASYLIGHEGKGSLLSALKARGWATALSAGDSDYGSFSLFSVSITLTELGMDNMKEVGAMLFSYIKLLQTLPVEQWVLDEIRSLRSVRFKFADDVQPYGLVNRIAQSLQNYPASHVLSAASTLQATDAEASAGVLQQLTVEGVRVELAAKRFEPQCSAQDPWYSGPYVPRVALPSEWLASWAAAAAATEADARAHAALHGLAFVAPNPFVPEDLSLHAPEPSTQLPGLLPAFDGSHKGVACFHRQDDRFLQPKAICAFRFHCPAAAEDAASYLRVQMWCNALAEELNEYTYDAGQAGLGYSLSATSGGFELMVSGFVDKMPLLLRTVATKMREMTEVSDETFSIVRDRYQRALKNTVFKQRPCDLSARRSRDLRFSLSFPAEDRLELLQTMSASDLAGVNTRLLRNCHVEGLSVGNVRAADAGEMASLVEAELGLRESPSVDALPWRAEMILPPGRTLLRCKGTDPDERNNAVRCEIQVPRSLQMQVGVSLFTRILSPRFFEELRTKQQLGYIVQMASAVREGSCAIVFTIQTEYPPEYVRGRIDAFLEEHMAWLEQELEESEFFRHRDGLASNLAEAPKNLNEEFSRYWNEIDTRRFDFTWRSKKHDAVAQATLSELKRFVGLLREAPRLYVEVHSISASEGKAAKDDVPVTNADRIWEELAEASVHRGEAKWVGFNTNLSVAANSDPENDLAPRSRM